MTNQTLAFIPAPQYESRNPEHAALVSSLFADVTRRDQMPAEVQHVLRRLDQPCRDLVILHHSVGLPVDCAAAWLGLPPARAECQLAQGEAAVAASTTQ